MIKRYELCDIGIDEILARDKAAAADVGADVARIIAEVRERGDAALRDYAKKFDGAELSSLLVTEREIDEAMASVAPELIAVLARAGANIEAFHRKQVRQGFMMTPQDGVLLGQRLTPLERVGIYVPGGTASYPSSVLMNAVPARVAGVGEIIMATPPRTEALKKLTAPALVLHGTRDTLIDWRAGQHTAQCIPNSEFVLIDGWGHDVPAGGVPTLTDYIASFIRRAEAGR